MFCGIVEITGEITTIHLENGCLHFAILPHTPWKDLAVGESIAVNGVCLTVTHHASDIFYVTAVPETLKITNLALLKTGSWVNLERSIQSHTRIGGHYIQGHVDSLGQILNIELDNNAASVMKISIPRELSKFIVNKGYIGIDGMSLTVIHAGLDYFTLTLIPHTLKTTIAGQYCKGHSVNIEVDILGKYVNRLLGEGHYAASN